jgi:putative mRNA 3-end processing factor
MMLFDPIESDPTIPTLFVSHAHFDHSKGFQFPTQKIYSTKETMEVYEADSGRLAGNWEPIRLGRRMKLAEVEVEAHDAGHMLGSVQYEIITPEGNLVYASHLNFSDTLLFRAAEVAPCETLILEATFPARALKLPPREQVIADMVKWTLECVREKRIPALAVEPVGNAQELTKIFNVWTELPVVVHPQIARVNGIYGSNGTALRYVDAATPAAEELVGQGQCVVLIPRRFDASRFGDFRVAYVTAWPSLTQSSAGKIFPLSDQADLDHLLKFVQETRAKTVLTFRGGSRVLAELVTKKFGVVGRELPSVASSPKQTVVSNVDPERVAECEDLLRKVVQVQNFTYEKRDLLGLGLKEGFKPQVVEQALTGLTQKGVLRYSSATDGYSLAETQ